MGNVYNPYIRMEFGSKSLTWNYKDSAPDLFTSLIHKRYTEKANELLLDITYAPTNGSDPNLIEYYIAASGGVCKFYYGYGAKNCLGPYVGIIKTYKVSIENGVLLYSFKFVSALYATESIQIGNTNFTKSNSSIDIVEEKVKSIIELTGYTYDPKVNFQERLVYEEISIPGNSSPLIALRSIISSMKVRKHELTGDLDANRQGLFEDLYDATMWRDHVVANTNGTGQDEAAIEDAEGKVNNIQSQIDEIDSISPNHYLDLDINDQKKTISVVIIDGSESITNTYQFNWGTKDSIVISWSPDFDGSYMVFTSNTNTDSMIQTLPSEAEARIVTIQTNVPKFDENIVTPSFLEQFENYNINERKLNTFYAYKATLVVRGQLSSPDLGKTTIQVIPIVGGKTHHSAGTYTIIGVEDSVSSEGFTTTYTLVKNSNAYNIYKSGQANTKVYYNGSYADLSEYDPASMSNMVSSYYHSINTTTQSDNLYSNLESHITKIALVGKPCKKYAESQAKGVPYTNTVITYFINPISFSSYCSEWGYRVHPIGKDWRMHNGVDLSAGRNTPIYAAETGKVVANSYESGGAGYYINIEHPNGFLSKYMHMVGPGIVSVGSTVKRGQKIGYCDTTGGSTGDHLHFGLYFRGESVDPEDFIDLRDQSKVNVLGFREESAVIVAIPPKTGLEYKRKDGNGLGGCKLVVKGNLAEIKRKIGVLAYRYDNDKTYTPSSTSHETARDIIPQSGGSGTTVFEIDHPLNKIIINNITNSTINITVWLTT